MVDAEEQYGEHDVRDGQGANDPRLRGVEAIVPGQEEHHQVDNAAEEESHVGDRGLLGGEPVAPAPERVHLLVEDDVVATPVEKVAQLHGGIVHVDVVPDQVAVQLDVGGVVGGLHAVRLPVQVAADTRQREVDPLQTTRLVTRAVHHFHVSDPCAQLLAKHVRKERLWNDAGVLAVGQQLVHVADHGLPIGALRGRGGSSAPVAAQQRPDLLTGSTVVLYRGSVREELLERRSGTHTAGSLGANDANARRARSLRVGAYEQIR
mmetsp:Transcript_11792/g.35951  ORF Transcript_11792/g.35951 Transcript_11792/m.35951 type:complete len:264 (+) Transcript_11792:1326-2117(+)